MAEVLQSLRSCRDADKARCPREIGDVALEVMRQTQHQPQPHTGFKVREDDFAEETAIRQLHSSTMQR